jgi:hypothetical protein
MPAMMSNSAEPTKITKVKKVVAVRADVERLLPRKYLGTSYHWPSSFFARYIL